MVNINLKGVLGRKFGEKWKLRVASVFEIFEAIQANNPKFAKYYSELRKFFTHFMIFVDGKLLPSHLLKAKILKKNTKVDILPIVQGGGVEIVLLIIAIILIVASLVLTLLLSPKAPSDVKYTKSSTLSNARNVLNRNIVVPVGYGRLRLGSAVVSTVLMVSYSGGGKESLNLNSSSLEQAIESFYF